MKLANLAHLSEIVSGIAIVVTLIVLVTEVRSNSALLERQLEIDRRETQDIADSDHLLDVLAKIKAVDTDELGLSVAAFMQRYDLTYVEAERWVRYLRRQWRGYEADFSVGDTAGLASQISVSLGFSDQRLYWKEESRIYDPEFARFVDSVDVVMFGTSAED